MKRLRLLQDHFYLSISIVLRALRLHFTFEKEHTRDIGTSVVY